MPKGTSIPCTPATLEVGGLDVTGGATWPLEVGEESILVVWWRAAGRISSGRAAWAGDYEPVQSACVVPGRS